MGKGDLLIRVLIIPTFASNSYLLGVAESNKLSKEDKIASLAIDQDQAKNWIERKGPKYFDQVIEV